MQIKFQQIINSVQVQFLVFLNKYSNNSSKRTFFYIVYFCSFFFSIYHILLCLSVTYVLFFYKIPQISYGPYGLNIVGLILFLFFFNCFLLVLFLAIYYFILWPVMTFFFFAFSCVCFFCSHILINSIILLETDFLIDYLTPISNIEVLFFETFQQSLVRLVYLLFFNVVLVSLGVYYYINFSKIFLKITFIAEQKNNLQFKHFFFYCRLFFFFLVIFDWLFVFLVLMFESFLFYLKLFDN